MLKEAKKLLKEADEIGLSELQLSIYMVEKYPKLKNYSHNTVRRWFKDIRQGLYE